MTILLLIIVIGLLIHIISLMKNGDKEKKKEFSYQELLPDYIHKNCEIRVKRPMAAIDVMYSAQGVLTGFDSDWIWMEKSGKKKTVVKVFRIENIASIKEIVRD